jgi:hypothetical protein
MNLFSDGVPFFFPFYSPVILGENHRKRKFCPKLFPWDTNLIGGGLLPVSLGCQLGGPYFRIPGAFSYTKMSLSKKSKKVFSRPISTLENSINGRVKICLFLKNRPSIYNMFEIGNTSRLHFS